MALRLLPRLLDDAPRRAVALRIIRHLGNHRFTVHNTRSFLAAVQQCEGEAALELEQYEDSALAFFEGLQIDGDNADCKRMFDEAIARGRAAAARTQK